MVSAPTSRWRQLPSKERTVNANMALLRTRKANVSLQAQAFDPVWMALSKATRNTGTSFFLKFCFYFRTFWETLTPGKLDSRNLGQT